MLSIPPASSQASKNTNRPPPSLLVFRLLLAIPAFVFLFAVPAAADSPPAKKRPNIVVILVDDMGFADIGCYGSEIPTPHLDKLAAGGLRFTQFYNTGRCCPTRAALLTGLYSHQAGVGHMVENQNQPGYQGHLNDHCVTIAEVLHDAGYFTAMTGKWHVGQNHGVTPKSRGFDRSLNAAAGGFYYAQHPRAELFLDGEKIPLDHPSLPKNWYTTDLWTDFGIRFIDQARQEKKPFFLYLAHNAPHFSLQAPAEEIASFRGKYQTGWDALRTARHEKQLALGIVEKSWPLSSRPDPVAAWTSLGPAKKDRFDHLMAIYAACIQHMDTAVGRLVAALRERGELDNTLILFLSDNGANAESGPEGRLDGDPPGGPRSDVFVGQSWATLSNTPFRRYKHFNHEGGIATPLIAHWPSGIAARNELRHQPGHLIDILPTCVEVAEAKYPETRSSHKILPPEGTSLVKAFAGEELSRDALYWEHEGNAAIRQGDWKLVRAGRGGAWELYNLKQDRTELHNLAEEQPQRVGELKAKWHAWAERAHVLPFPGQDQEKKKNKKASADSDWLD